MPKAGKYVATPHPLFDALQRELGIKNDADLCRKISVEPPTLSKIRNGHLLLNDTVRVSIMRRFHWPLEKLDYLCPPAPKDGK